MDAKTDESAGKCPFTGRSGHKNRDWWPSSLDIEMLHRNSPFSDPMGKEFDYAKGHQPPQAKLLNKNEILTAG
jgi:catalase-peroxidase